MTDKKEQAREFWLKNDIKNLGKDGFLYCNTEISVHDKCIENYEDFKDAIHVIEITALQYANAKISELERENKKIQSKLVLTEKLLSLPEIIRRKEIEDYNKHQDRYSDRPHDLRFVNHEYSEFVESQINSILYHDRHINLIEENEK